MTIITLKLLWDPSIVIRARKNNFRNIGAKNQLLVDPNVHLIQGGSETLGPIELLSQLKMPLWNFWNQIRTIEEWLEGGRFMIFNQLLVDPNVHLIQGGSETLGPIELLSQLKRMRSFQVWLRNLFSAILQLTVVKISLI